MKSLKKYVYMSPETEILSLEAKYVILQESYQHPTEGSAEDDGWGAPWRY